MKYATTNYIFLRYSFEEAVKRIAEAGYDGIEIWGGRPHTYPPDMDLNKVKKMKGFIKRYNLKIVCFTPEQCFYPINPAYPEPEFREETINYMRKSIDIAAGLDTNKMVITGGHASNMVTKPEAMRIIEDTLRKLTEYASTKKVTLMLEPLTLYESNTITNLSELTSMLEKINSPWLKGMLDTGHANVTGESFSDYVYSLGKRLTHIHLDDNFKDTDAHLIPGKGNIDFKPLLDLLKEKNYQGFLSLELGFIYNIDPDRAIREGLHYLRSLEK